MIVFLTQSAARGTFRIQTVPPGIEAVARGRYSGKSHSTRPDVVPKRDLIISSLLGGIPEKEDTGESKTGIGGTEHRDTLTRNTPVPIPMIPESKANSTKSPIHARFPVLYS